MKLPQSFIEIDKKTWLTEVAVCRNFRLEVEDHGLFTAALNFEGSGWGQGISPHALDNYDEVAKKRVGTAFGCDYIMECVRVLGSPENAKGAQVVVFRDSEYGDIKGFARLSPDGTINEPFFPQKLADKHFPK